LNPNHFLDENPKPTHVFLVGQGSISKKERCVLRFPRIPNTNIVGVTWVRKKFVNGIVTRGEVEFIREATIIGTIFHLLLEGM